MFTVTCSVQAYHGASTCFTDFFSSSGIHVAWCLSVFTVACFSFRMLYFAAHWVPSDLGFFFSGLWGLFLERPGNLTGPESDFDISLKKRRACSDF